ncbi:glycoside hydrolase family 88 protein [Paenibacillus sp. 2RAB27]|uniref:glycoside hydrolase family 88 protein n=1 Tax=Paenibacillus sp. 2RAB27 TaxID=3232991 RepID=UPI003F991B3F
MKRIYELEIESIIQQIDRNLEDYGHRFPHIHRDGRYAEHFSEDGSWTGSFWTGMVAMAYRYTNNPKYLMYLHGYLSLYQERLETGYTDHDLGFLYQLYAVEMYRLTGSSKYKELAVDAADKLLARYHVNGGFIRAWGPVESDIRRGKIIIDCMMNLTLLYSASALTGDPKYREAALSHAENSRKHLLRHDFSTYHTFDFDPESGNPIGGFCEDGYGDESTWSRGQAWGVYGFQLSYELVGKMEFRDAAAAMADYFIKHTPESLIPPWDFRLPDGAIQLHDCSASAIAISGMFDLAESLDDTVQADYYRSRANDMLQALMPYSSAGEKERNGIMSSCYGRTEEGQFHMYTIWGDFFYMEALFKAIGLNWRMWSSSR